ncbi:hypothetical protein KW842_24805 [Duganella sp. sic0402]|uniref:hypothetical protein n=1 Tax=Duganella sp. sic0402 TaxID=2854786 RepID=UPI001C47DBB5|nr:hypothetical protein [Duganella sp. sic0402]MBV7538994.1 hypothetical protein [Duganella sp. sic0402]
MKLLHTPAYSIRVITLSDADTVPLCEIIMAGKATGVILQGAVFEAALKWHDYTLLFLTNDVPFEDTLNIYLLDRDLNVADYARMYFMYATGIFSDLDLTEADTVRFNFLGEKRWILKLFSQKRFFVPVASSALEVHRPFTFFRRFQLSAQALPSQDRESDKSSQG